MKALGVASIATGLAACLAVYVLSGPRSSQPAGVTATVRPTLKMAPTPGPIATTLGQSSTQVGAPPRSREQQSEQLQLEIARALASADESDRERAYTQLVSELIKTDPDAMKRLLEHYPAGLIREQLLRYTAHTWSSVDLQGAIAWAKGVNDEGERAIAATEIVSQVGQSNPGHAIEVSDALGVGRNDGTVDHIAQIWAIRDLQAALDWTGAQPPGPQRDQILQRIVTVQAERSPADAANTVLQQMSAGPAQTNAIAPIIREWSIRDTAAASAWAQDLPQGPLRDVATGEIARTVRARSLASVGSP